MRHAVILAHPAPESLNRLIATTYVEAARGLGQAADLIDLYAIGFDPCLKAAEIPGPNLPRFGADVERERHRLAEARVFAFVYPLWFNGPPAILKGYIDRVFGMGFGFEPVVGGMEPQLNGRRLISITTSGAPDDWLSETSALEPLQLGFDHHIGAVCGLTVLDHLHFGGMTTGVRQDVVDRVVASVRQAVASHFAC
ncbi:NAD(P)H-dependent oxidoreductase [Phenylobacterium immobile]|uniref:NAD(P)H-dependent oxidoreductase n=1 Tax=Phenylobacterium immobile TaxID=21 RepID=UPI000AC90DD0|nr:NAD(P)H-dependent oxidoreductase [Phenylobacterium immobile]